MLPGTSWLPTFPVSAALAPVMGGKHGANPGRTPVPGVGEMARKGLRGWMCTLGRPS